MLSYAGCIAVAFLAGYANAAMDANPKGTNWAVLVAGSNSYYNYRHQADVAHAYKILTQLGDYPKDNVIVMMYNDVVNSTDNPFPGQLFNEPGGDDVWGDIVVDYQGDDVTAENFLKVLRGEGSGKVLKSGCDDNVFIYYSDHGAPGLVAMPHGEPLYADDLNKTLQHMHKHCMYHELVFYLEACESGSMFEGILSNSTKIFATTAATGDEPSYAFYYNDTLSTYMADEYSIRWMQDSTKHWSDITHESLQQQFQDIRGLVKESTPQQYGDLSFCEEAVEDFEGYDFQNRSGIYQLLRKSISGSKKDDEDMYMEEWDPSTTAISSRDVKLAVLQHRFLAAKDTTQRTKAAERVHAEIIQRIGIDVVFEELIHYVAAISHSRYVVTDIETNAFISGHLRPQNWKCLKSSYRAYERHCGRFTDYSLQYVNALSNLCEIFDDADLIEEGLRYVCEPVQ